MERLHLAKSATRSISMEKKMQRSIRHFQKISCKVDQKNFGVGFCQKGFFTE